MLRRALAAHQAACALAFAMLIAFSLYTRAGAMSNGVVVDDPAEAPWAVALIVATKESTPAMDRLKCGGVLIAPDKVLTAAHCVVAPDSFSTDPAIEPKAMNPRTVLAMLAGGRLDDQNAAVRKISQVFVDPDYHLLASPTDPRDPSRAAAKHDLAVLVLESAFGDSHPALQLAAAKPDAGAPVRMYGHGLTPSGDVSADLLRGDLTLISSHDCDAQVFVDVKYVGALCAETTTAPELSSQAAFGDSGGPLVAAGPNGGDELLGVVSFGTETTGHVFAAGFNAFGDVAAGRDFIAQYAPDAVWAG